jgi:hypothetical protein
LQTFFSVLRMLPWAKIIWPVVALTLTTGLIQFIRWFGKHPVSVEAVGSDLNLVSFGFAIDLLIKLMKGETILPLWPYATPTLVPALSLMFINLILFMLNLSMGEYIEKGAKTGKARKLKFISLFFGLISALLFVCAGGIWG